MSVLPSPLRRSVTGHVLVVAHRGLSAEEPENTMRSFRRAAEVGCDLIELDVHAWGATSPPRREEVEALVRAGVDSVDANDPRLVTAMLAAIG